MLTSFGVEVFGGGLWEVSRGAEGAFLKISSQEGTWERCFLSLPCGHTARRYPSVSHTQESTVTCYLGIELFDLQITQFNSTLLKQSKLREQWITRGEAPPYSERKCGEAALKLSRRWKSFKMLISSFRV